MVQQRTSRYRVRRRANRGKRTAAAAIRIITGIVCALAVAALIVTAARIMSGPKVSERADIGDSDRLTYVRMPDNTPQEVVEYDGFTVNFNSKAHIPNYVAWELTRDETDGSHPRLNKFFNDPDVDGCPYPTDYRHSGYTRGHMAPAADLKWSAEAMRHSHYLTNVCPQMASLNSGAWSKLEENCRDWARRDSALIIICGPVLDERTPKRIGSSGIVVPERFFKVVLAPYAVPPRGIAFIMPNGRVNGGVQAAAVSIDEVEAATGIDFFSSLPDTVEDAVESMCSYPRWQSLK